MPDDAHDISERRHQPNSSSSASPPNYAIRRKCTRAQQISKILAPSGPMNQISHRTFRLPLKIDALRSPILLRASHSIRQTLPED